MIIFLLSLWIVNAPTPLILGAFTTSEKCNLEAIKYKDNPRWFALCQILEVKE